MRNHHFLIVCFPVHGHINPSLELARRLTDLGHHVTFATTVLGSHKITTITNKKPTTLLSFTTLSDGSDEQTTPNKSTGNITQFFDSLKLHGSRSLTNLFISNQQSHNPFTFVIYSLLFHWVADIATSFHFPSALLFVQPATLLVLYYYYFYGYGDTIPNQKLQGLPLLSTNDMPSLLSPSSPHAHLLPFLKQQIEVLLDQKSKPKVVLVNTFDALEVQALELAIDGLKMLGIGPLIPNFDSSPSFDGNDIDHDDCIEWLNSKPNSSVVYISFGSIYVLSNTQKEEILHALLESGFTFLWVMIGVDQKEAGKDECCNLLLEGQGKIVSWCRQIEVLKHPSLGCFVSHCGWNSTLESLNYGLPMVAFPQQVDQPTNAKLVEDVWKVGVRVKANLEGIVGKEEIRKCLELIMGRSRDDEQRTEIIMENAKKWKKLASQAIGEDGVFQKYLYTYVVYR
ncbi:UDP-glycosyltransferase 75C1 [Cucumis sativus]|uniref:UDP-glycosyltransferase 75C1 n=1 Tax=Cucumis sativus TaxID=3659 RepID=UPI0012F48927|nr:UDP-glycosyltransferase 75C1 [Cucumis sativus]